jgi:hypothetical protein
MTTEKVLDELTDAAGRIGVEVRSEKGNFDGGRCTVDGATVVMLNERHLPERRLAILARALREEDMEAVYLPPAVRKTLHETWADEAVVEDAAEEEVVEGEAEEHAAHAE